MNQNVEFKNIINEYIKILNCTATDLAKKSDISPSIISRYRSGEKTPKNPKVQVEKIINAIVEIAKEKNIPNINKNDVKKKFDECFNTKIDFELFKNNLNLLIEELNINVADISHYLGYDPSYLSKIRSGIRKPAHTYEFVNGISKFIINNYTDTSSTNKILNILNVDSKITKDKTTYLQVINNFLIKNEKSSDDNEKILHFLKNINNFNLNDYIKTIHFDEIKVPTFPITIPKSKIYYGLTEMRQGELDFLKGTVLAKSKNDVFMCSDMQMDDMAKDIEFGKKWMFGIAMMLKKGIKLNIIHNLDRPFNEMMLGLESWILIYMTGQVKPFYFKNFNDKIYGHLNYVSNNYALCGECINGFHKHGKYYLTNNKKEVSYYQEKAKYLLNKATPLMEIYKSDNLKELNDFYKKDIEINSPRKRILNTLPIHTISDELFIKILKENNITSNKEINKYRNYLKKDRKYINNLILNNSLTDEIILLNKEEFEKTNMFFNFNNYIANCEIKYSYDTYLKHYEETIKYKKNNYNVITNKKFIFDNISIYINQNNYVVITKEKHPYIHFVIKHEKLRNAITNFIPQV